MSDSRNYLREIKEAKEMTACSYLLKNMALGAMIAVKKERVGDIQLKLKEEKRADVVDALKKEQDDLNRDLDFLNKENGVLIRRGQDYNAMRDELTRLANRINNYIPNFAIERFPKEIKKEKENLKNEFNQLFKQFVDSIAKYKLDIAKLGLTSDDFSGENKILWKQAELAEKLLAEDYNPLIPAQIQAECVLSRLEAAGCAEENGEKIKGKLKYLALKAALDDYQKNKNNKKLVGENEKVLREKCNDCFLLVVDSLKEGRDWTNNNKLPESVKDLWARADNKYAEWNQKINTIEKNIWNLHFAKKMMDTKPTTIRNWKAELERCEAQLKDNITENKTLVGAIEKRMKSTIERSVEDAVKIMMDDSRMRVLLREHDSTLNHSIILQDMVSPNRWSSFQHVGLCGNEETSHPEGFAGLKKVRRLLAEEKDIDELYDEQEKIRDYIYYYKKSSNICNSLYAMIPPSDAVLRRKAEKENKKDNKSLNSADRFQLVKIHEGIIKLMPPIIQDRANFLKGKLTLLIPLEGLSEKTLKKFFSDEVLEEYKKSPIKYIEEHVKSLEDHLVLLKTLEKSLALIKSNSFFSRHGFKTKKIKGIIEEINKVQSKIEKIQSDLDQACELSLKVIFITGQKLLSKKEKLPVQLSEMPREKFAYPNNRNKADLPPLDEIKPHIEKLKNKIRKILFEEIVLERYRKPLGDRIKIDYDIYRNALKKVNDFEKNYPENGKTIGHLVAEVTNQLSSYQVSKQSTLNFTVKVGGKHEQFYDVFQKRIVNERALLKKKKTAVKNTLERNSKLPIKLQAENLCNLLLALSQGNAPEYVKKRFLLQKDKLDHMLLEPRTPQEELIKRCNSIRIKITKNFYGIYGKKEKPDDKLTVAQDIWLKTRLKIEEESIELQFITEDLPIKKAVFGVPATIKVKHTEKEEQKSALFHHEKTQSAISGLSAAELTHKQGDTKR